MGSDLFFNDGELQFQATPDEVAGGNASGVHVKLDPANILTLSDETNTLYGLGGAGDSVDAGDGWSAVGQETVDGAVFNVYTQGDAVLKVDCDIDQTLIGLA